MKIIKISLSLLLSFILTIAYIPIYAAPGSVYVGAGYGTTSADTGVTAITATLDEDDSGFKLFVGRKMDKYFAIEGFYADFGEASLTGNTGDTFIIDGFVFAFGIDNAAIISEATAIGFNGLFSLPITDKFSVFGKLGLIRWDYEITASGSGVPSQTTSDDGTDSFFGFGASYKINDDWSIRGDYDLYEIDDGDVDMLSLNIIKSF